MMQEPLFEITDIERFKSDTLDMWHVCGGYKKLPKRKGMMGVGMLALTFNNNMELPNSL